MEKEFISYDLALRMKGLGFDEPCIAFYEPNNKEVMVVGVPQRYNDPSLLCLKDFCAPTYSQAFRWFREKYDLHYQLIPFFSDKESHAVDYYLALAQHRPPIQVKTFEEAETACLQKLIEIVEQSKSE
jgi:hypothetical protein